MNKSVKIILLLIIIVNFFSCSKDEQIKEDQGVPTELKGKVFDNYRGINIEGYKIVFSKSWNSCSNYACGLTVQEIATTYTDVNGNYLIKFNYKLNPGESYGLSEQYYGTPYYPEYLPSSAISPGQVNIININAWSPIILQLNLVVSNNVNAPLMVRNELATDSNKGFGLNNIYEQNITKTYNQATRPNSDIKIKFWYNSGTSANPLIHEKYYNYHTTTENVNVLNYNVDCSTF